jgi:hypothetical protein
MAEGIGAHPRSRAADLYTQFVTHGEATIQKLIDEQVSEELFIDYKRVTSDGENPRLEQADKENFARAVCGFANSEGGVIVWGVDCRNDPQRGDVPGTKHPIRNVKRFLSYLEGATSGCSLPPHDGVRHHAIESAGTKNGFVVTFVPKSMFAPHQCIVGKYKDRYYVRVGSNFEIASHGLLAGMFGRQPVPNIFHLWGCGGKTTPQSWAPLVTWHPTSTPYVWLEITIRNHGVTVVRDVYVNSLLQIPGPNCRAEMSKRDPEFRFSESLGGWHLISQDQYRLAPAGMVAPFSLTLYLKPPFEVPLRYELSFGCAGSPVHRVVATVPPATIEQAYNAYIATHRGEEAGLELVKAVFALEGDQEYYRSVDF